MALVCESANKPFYSTYGTARAAGWLEHPLWNCIESDELFEINGLSVNPVTVPHDSQQPVQFVVHDGQWRFGAISDLGCVTPHVVREFQQCDGLFLEANHDLQLLQQGPYPPSLKRRVGGDYGHLNNHQAGDLLARIQWQGLQHFTASHISEKNNQLDLVKQILAPVLGCSEEELDAAQQDTGTGWRELS